MRSGVRVDSESRERQPRSLPHVRRPARDRGGARHVDRGNPVAATRGYGSPGIADIAFWCRGVGRHRCASLPRDHRLPVVRARLRAGVPDLEGRPRHLGRGDRGRARGHRHHEAPAHAHPGRDGLPRAHATSSRRRSAGGGTGSTRSCSGNRPRRRGPSRSPSRTGRPATSSSRRSSPRSCTSRSTACSRSGSCCSSSASCR